MTMIYSGEKTSSTIFFIIAVQALDLLLALIIEVFPPAIDAAKTPKESRIGKLNGEIIKETP